MSPDLDSADHLNRYESYIYRPVQIYGTYFLDITLIASVYTDIQCLQELARQHLNTLRKDTSKYLETYIESNVNNNIELVFDQKKLHILPRKALGNDTTVTKVKLTHLPCYQKFKLLKA